MGGLGAQAEKGTTRMAAENDSSFKPARLRDFIKSYSVACAKYNLSEASSLVPIPAIGSIARGTQRLNCSMRGSITGIGKELVVRCPASTSQ